MLTGPYLRQLLLLETTTKEKPIFDLRSKKAILFSVICLTIEGSNSEKRLCFCNCSHVLSVCDTNRSTHRFTIHSSTEYLWLTIINSIASSIFMPSSHQWQLVAQIFLAAGFQSINLIFSGKHEKEKTVFL